MTKEENINIKIQNGEKLTLTEAMSVLKRYHFDWRCSQALDIVLESVNSWHYPSKGEYPPNNKWVLVYLNDETCTVGLYCSWAEFKWIDTYENDIYYRDIVAWQYIVPPKEIK